MATKIKAILLSLMLAMIAAPLIQDTLRLFTPGPLYGYYSQASDVTFDIDKWLRGEFQEQKSQFLKDHMGFREDFIRLHNQIDLSLFEILHGDAVLGKHRYLFQQCYIDAHYGKDFLGYDSIKAICLKLKYIQDGLTARGKTFLVIHAPTKDNIYPEYLPDMPGASTTNMRNTIVYRHLCDSLNINHIDVESLFIKNKPTAKGPLFTQQGTHWSLYGSYIASDTIIKWIERARNTKLPELHIASIEYTHKARYTDNDIGWAFNLMSPFSNELYAYPVTTYNSVATTEKPRLVLVGDSFNWTLISNGLTDSVFSNWQFWYYFKNIKTRDNMEAPVEAFTMNGYNWRGAIDSTDCIIVSYVPDNLPEMNEFLDSAYMYLNTKAKQ